MPDRVLYDLAGADEDRRFSPYCWRARLALAHKGLEVETIAWRFTDDAVSALSSQGKVPVLVDGGKVIADSWAIAVYLEETYPNRPSLFGGDAAMAVTRFVNSWADRTMIAGMFPMIAHDIYRHIHEKDRAYFRATREQRLGGPLEDAAADRETRVVTFRKSLEPVRALLAEQAFVGGATPTYADYILFGGFQWAACVSSFPMLAPDDPLNAWRDRIADLFDGLGRKGVKPPLF